MTVIALDLITGRISTLDGVPVSAAEAADGMVLTSQLYPVLFDDELEEEKQRLSSLRVPAASPEDVIEEADEIISTIEPISDSQSLDDGLLEVMTEVGGQLGWAQVPDPAGTTTSTRNQVASTRRFNGGEGICVLDDAVVFTTKGDNRVWRYTPGTNTLQVIYDAATSPTSGRRTSANRDT